jgi:isopentenyl phosphate kinase
VRSIKGLIVVEFGGSSITFKERTFSLNKEAIENISSSLCNFKGKLFIIHGIGSWGLPVAIAYGLNSFTYKKDIGGVSLTRMAILELSKNIQTFLINYGINPFFFLPQYTESMMKELETLYKNGAVPLTYEDVIYEKGKGYRIMRGEEIIDIIANVKQVKRVLFIIKSNGIIDYKGKTIDLISIKSNKGIKINQTPIMEGNLIYTFDQIRAKIYPLDAISGITYKLLVAERLVKKGIEVLFLSSDNKDNIIKALNGKKFYGTRVIY